MGVSGRSMGVPDVNVYISTDVFNSTVTSFLLKIFQQHAYSFWHPTFNMCDIKHPPPSSLVVPIRGLHTYFFQVSKCGNVNNVSTVNASHLSLLSFSRRCRLVAIPPPPHNKLTLFDIFFKQGESLTTHQPIKRKYKKR